MTYLYSPSARGFFLREVHGDAVPSDAVEITVEEHTALLDAQGAGMAIIPGAGGKPVASAADPSAPQPTPAQVRADRNARLSASDWTQLPDVDLTQPQVMAWRGYRGALRALDLSDPIWPEPPA